MEIAVEPGDLTACSRAVSRAAETFSGMSRSVQDTSGSAAAVAGTPHASTGLSDFGAHWTAALGALGAGATAAAEHLQGASATYAAVDARVARAAGPR